MSSKKKPSSLTPAGEFTTSEFVTNLKSEAASRLVAAAGGAGAGNNGIKALAAGRSDIFRVNPYTINVVPNWNSRDFTMPENIAHVERLALDITENGIKEPLTVYWNKATGALDLVDGESRLRAIQRAIEILGNTRLKEVPVKTEVAFSTDAERVMSQITRNGAKPLNPVERASVLFKAFELGMSVEEIARKAVADDGGSLTPTRVKQILAIRAGLTPKVKDFIGAGRLSFSRFGAILKDSKDDAATAEQAVVAQFAVAQSRGEERIFQKHSKILNGGAPRVNAKKIVIDMLADAKVKESGDSVSITMSMGDYQKLLRIRG